MYPLVQRFGALLREHRVADLDTWLRASEESGIPEFVRFVQSLRRDQVTVSRQSLPGGVRAKPRGSLRAQAPQAQHVRPRRK